MTERQKTYWEVDYLFIAHIMDMPVQCIIDVSDKVDQFITLSENLSEQLNTAEEVFVNPLIDKKEEKKK